MKRVLSVVLGIVLFTCGQADAAIKMTIDSAIHQVASQVKSALTDNIVLKGKKVAIGNFDPEGSRARKSNFSLGIQQKLTELLQEFRDDDSDITVSGNYVFTSGNGDNSGLDIVRMVVSIKELGKRVQVFPDIEINDTNSIYAVIGGTGAPPQNGDLKERNEAAKNDIVAPDFALVDGHRVAAKGNPKLSMGILKKKTFSGSTSLVVPENVKGFAFTNVGVGEYYEIELANHDTIDVVARITVDGLDVANTFTSDVDPDGKKANYRGFVVPKGGNAIVKGWLHTIDQSKTDNVFTFVVNQLGQGAATQLNTRGAVGVITVQFREACPPNGTLSRSVDGGETGKGEPLDQKFKKETLQIGDNVLSTVSIRYNRPQ